MTSPSFDIVQNRGWNGERVFRLWVADDALRGVYLQDRGGWTTGLSASPLPDLGLPLVVVAGAIALLFAGVASAFVAIRRATREEEKQKRAKTFGEGKVPATASGEIMHRRRMKAFDGRSDEFLGWDERNFHISRNDITHLELLHKTYGWAKAKSTCELHLTLCSGQEIRWTIPDAAQRAALAEILNEAPAIRSFV